MRYLFLFSLFSFFTSALWAQQSDSLTWEDFRAEYFDAPDLEEEGFDNETEARLEELARQHPDVNAVNREFLLQLPFLSEAEADSILAFRERKGGVWSLNELVFVSGLSLRAQRYLPLFLGVTPTETDAPLEKAQGAGGAHELSTRLDVPLYRRAGYRTYTAEELAESPNKQYVGNRLAHVLRYRYRKGEAIRFGATLEKDGGEPFFRRKNYPYDYVSAYAQYGPSSDKWRVLVGDYKVAWGQGLAMSSSLWSNRQSLLDAPVRTAVVFRPHTSTEENRFFRGAAALVRLGRLELAGFASWRRLDANADGDTVRTLQTTGYHRTEGELARKDKVTALTFGGHLSWSKGNVQFGAGGFYLYYDKIFLPATTVYNRNYFRGQDAYVLSADWKYASQHFSVVGEVAADKDFHIAFSQTLSYAPLQKFTLTLQHRHLSPRFVSPYGRTLQLATRVCNEHGVYFGLNCGVLRRLSLRAYVDYARLPEPVYRTSAASNRIEALGEVTWTPRRRLSAVLRYKMKAVQRDVTGQEGLIEYVTTHRLRLQTHWRAHTRRPLSIHAQIDGTYVARQTADAETGWGASCRVAWQPWRSLSTGFSTALFMTDGYASAVYASEPRFPYSYGVPSLFDHGCRCAMLVNGHIGKKLDVGAWWGMTHYFNRSTISSGADEIASSTKMDLSFSVVWRF